MSAAYTAGILGNHPFVDGNKRTGFVIGILFLELDGYRFTASEKDAAQAVFSLAEGTLNEKGFAMFLRAILYTIKQIHDVYIKHGQHPAFSSNTDILLTAFFGQSAVFTTAR